MNKIKKKVFLIFLSLLITAACEYNPTGENEVFIDRPFMLPPEVSINNIGDTITLLLNTEINFNVDPKNNYLLKVEVDAGSYLYENFSEDTGSFIINSEYKEEGYYPLNIKVYVDPRTGSLANRLDAEIYYVEYFWQMHYVPMHIDWGRKKSRFFTAYIDNDKVNLSWQQYTLSDFDHYAILKRYIVDHIPVNVLITAIYDYNSTELIDDTDDTAYSFSYLLRIYRSNRSYIEDECYVQYP